MTMNGIIGAVALTGLAFALTGHLLMPVYPFSAKERSEQDGATSGSGI